MSASPHGEALESLVSSLLRGGITISMALILGGTALTFVHHPDYVTSGAALERLTQPGMAPSTLRAVFSGIGAIRGQAWVMLGVLALIATPVLRVAVSLIVFARIRDRAFTLLTAAVLALLLLSLLLGRAGG